MSLSRRNLAISIIATGMICSTFAHADYSNQASDFNNDMNAMKAGRNPNNLYSDEDLSKKIHDKIGPGWFSKGYDQVQIQVRGGNVILDGSVKTWEDKEKVEREVRNVNGVKKVYSQLAVEDQSSGPRRERQYDNRRQSREEREFPKDTSASPADNQLNRKIRDAISRGWLWDSYKEITLNTSNGIVTLEGTLDNRKDEEKLIAEIQKIDGVRKVKSNLRIKNQY